MSTVPTKPILAFAGYYLDARNRLLIGPDGAPVNISSRAFETLYYLASHPHELHPKKRLMEAVWPNSAVEDNNLNQQISTLRKLLGEAAAEQRFIVTVTGRGYRFVQDVRPLDSIPAPADGSRASSECALDVGDAADAAAATRPVRRQFRPAALAVVAAVAAVILLGAAYVLVAERQSDRTDADLPSIAVLPFANLSPDRDQDFFADGLSEELLTALGRLNGLRVIGRTSSFSFKGKNEDVRRVAATLGVQHVLEGSVRRDGNRLHITAELVDAANGTQLWAETYDRKLGDVFAIQREIADSVAATLRLAFRPGRDAAAAGGTRNVEAYEAYLAARAITNDGGSTRARDAIGLLERAVQLDPEFALAWAALAEDYMYAVDFPRSSALPLTPLELEQRITKAALRAFELAPGDWGDFCRDTGGGSFACR
jgi:TolB-like protein/DNA-binding winged helix-turn-helix (wHTH) protein